MKRIYTALLLLTFSFTAFADGFSKWEYERKSSIEMFEQNYRFFYKEMKDTIPYKTNSNQTKHLEGIVNIALYNIVKKSSVNLFKTPLKEEIVAFLFEENYNDSAKRMNVNYYTDHYENFFYNNKNIVKRKAANQLFVVTYSYINDKYTLWTARKNGTNLKALVKFDKKKELKIDVYNRKIIIVETYPKRVSFKQFAY